jgi:hypothetical protein
VLKYTFIESDLADAIAALPNKSVYAASEKSLKGAAYALLAKVNLTKRNGKVDNANLVTGYSLVLIMLRCLDLAGENDAESIFEIQGTGSIPARIAG